MNKVRGFAPSLLSQVRDRQELEGSSCTRFDRIGKDISRKLRSRQGSESCKAVLFEGIRLPKFLCSGTDQFIRRFVGEKVFLERMFALWGVTPADRTQIEHDFIEICEDRINSNPCGVAFDLVNHVNMDAYFN